MRKGLVNQKNETTQLQLENTKLKSQIMELQMRLSNLSGDKIVLQNQLGVIQQDMDGLKSNTSRLLGEKEGLQQVLKAKTKLEGHKIQAAKQVLDLASKSDIKNRFFVGF